MNRFDFKIRRATVADAALLAELGARTFAETFGPVNKPEDMTAYLEATFSPAKQTEEIVDPLSLFLIAESDVAAIGYARIKASRVPECVNCEKPIELVRLYVADEWLGCGVGAALMAACINEARELGYRTFWLGVWEHNQRAQAFYRKWGFKDVGTQIFQLGGDAQTDLVMELGF
jgi:ribosomal protein S18 acetylase RimI-like enzyme